MQQELRRLLEVPQTRRRGHGVGKLLQGHIDQGVRLVVARLDVDQANTRPAVEATSHHEDRRRVGDGVADRQQRRAIESHRDSSGGVPPLAIGRHPGEELPTFDPRQPSPAVRHSGSRRQRERALPHRLRRLDIQQIEKPAQRRHTRLAFAHPHGAIVRAVPLCSDDPTGRRQRLGDHCRP